MPTSITVRVVPGSKIRTVALEALLTIIVATVAVRASAQVEYVDPTIGNVGILLVPTRPAVYIPNSMIRVYPIRSDAMDDRIESFPLTINSHRIQELFSLMPGEDGKPAAWDQETTTPYYYSVYLGDSRIQTEFSATERCGYFRMTFPSGNASVVLANRLTGQLRVQEGGAVVGEERFNDMAAFVYGEFSPPVQFRLETIGDKSRLVASSSDSKVLEFRYGISFISSEQAKRNLNREIPAWGFERVKDAGRVRWNETLGQIAIEGGTDAQRKVFYTALYRCIPKPIVDIERTRVLMNLVIESTVIAAILSYVDHAFETPIQGSVEHLALRLGTAFYRNLTECLVPLPPSRILDSFKAPGWNLSVEIPLCLFGANERYSVAKLQHLGARA